MAGISQNPQNPYHSYIVRASAGCGKTYQLSRRFLFLVGAGSDPQSILTITFTKKAAAEMRERILLEAATLLRDSKQSALFEAQLHKFYDQYCKQAPFHPHAPRSASDTAKSILSATQLLRISTIDSIFMDWVRKFPWESRHRDELPLPLNFEIASELDAQILDESAWAELCHELYQSTDQATNLPAILSELMPTDLRLRIMALQKIRSFLWLVQQIKQQQGFDKSPFAEHKLPAMPFPMSSPKDFVVNLQSELIQLANETKKSAPLIQAIQEGNLADLIELKLLKNNWQVSGTTIKGKKRDANAEAIARIDEAASSYWNHVCLQNLNQTGKFLCDIFQNFHQNRDEIKLEQGFVEFDDMAKGCFRIFFSDDAVGARFLIHRRTEHILLDEFQDTSILQWSIFERIANEFLAGAGLENRAQIRPSVFIVGDAKQSIYGFREADSRILETAKQSLTPKQVLDVQLNNSYRTSQLVLDCVNMIFDELIADFPRHQTATKADSEEPVVPNHGSVAISPLFTANEEETGPSPVEQEAQFIASYIQAAINASPPLQVFDKAQGCLRPLVARDCVILYRAATHAGVYEQALRHLGLEAKREEGRGFFARQEIQDMKALLSFCCFRHDPLSLAIICKSPWTPVLDQHLLEALLAKGLKKSEPGSSIALVWQRLSEFHPEFCQKLQQLFDQSMHLSPFAVLERFYLDFEIPQAYLKAYGPSEGLLSEAHLRSFLEMVHDLEARGAASLPALIQKLEEMEHSDEMGAISESTNAITMMTIHKAKGLEYPLVALVGSGEAWEKQDPYWAKSNPDDEAGVYYIGTKSDHPEEDSNFSRFLANAIRESQDENLRLLYVALTRAKHHLLISGFQNARSQNKPGFHQTIVNILENDPDYKKKETGNWEILHREIHGNLPLGSPPKLVESKFSAKVISSEQRGLETLAPNQLLHRPEQSSQTLSRFQPFATEAGSFIHAGLEADLIQKNWESKRCWQGYYQRGDRSVYDSMLPRLEDELAAIISSAGWSQLKRQGQRFHPELAIAHHAQGQLIRGNIDLLVELNDQRLIVIDHKTSDDCQVAQDLDQWVKAHRYDQQLAAYVAAIRAIYPDHLVNSYIFLTALRRFHPCSQDFPHDLE